MAGGDVESGPKEPATDVVKISIVVACYFAVSIALVFFNKLIMTPEIFPFPLMVSWFQFLVALVCVGIMGWLGTGPVPSLSFIPPLSFDMRVAMQVSPVTLIFIAMIVFNNMCLQYVEVSFYQVARALTTLFTIIFGYTILGKGTSMQSMGACGVVVVGFVLGSAGELKFSWAGLIFGLVSSVFVALYGIYVKKVMHVLHDDHWKLLIYNTILSLIFLLPFLLFTEFNEIVNHPGIYDSNVWYLNVLAGFLGFAINIVVFLQIKLTSPLTNNIAGQVKAAVQTLLAIYFFENPISAMNAVGIFLVIAGSTLYSYVRFTETGN